MLVLILPNIEILLGPVIETKPPLPPILDNPEDVLSAPLASIEPVFLIDTRFVAVSEIVPPLAALVPALLLAAAFNLIAALI